MTKRSSRKSECGVDNRNATLADAVDEFTEQLNAGERPSVDEYVARYRDGGPALRSILETLLAMRPEGISDEQVPVEPFVPYGTNLGDFRILREIGRGGMGIVYEAEQISLQRRVALKILPFVALLDSPQLKRFRTEARAAAMLKHPNIVSVYSIGVERGVNYYAMELIDGPSLADLLSHPTDAHHDSLEIDGKSNISGLAVYEWRTDTDAEAKLSTKRPANRTEYFRQIAELGVQVAGALAYAHVEGVIHRDIKPANLLLDESGTLHVADFGLARVQSNADMTMSGDLLGTLRYMSPEQLAGDQLVDQRTDIYSLGLTLYELIARRPAFSQSARNELIKAISDVDPTSLLKVDRRIPLDLSTVVHKAIAKAPEDRYQHAGELADDLRRFLEHRPVFAKRTTLTGRLKRSVKRNPVVATLMALVFTLLTMISITSTLSARRQSIENRMQRSRLYARDMQLAQIDLNNRQTTHAENLLIKWTPEPGEEDHRGWEWYHLWARCRQSHAAWTIEHDSYIYDVAFSGDGRYLADASMGSRINIWDTIKDSHAEPTKWIELPTQMLATLKTTKDGAYLVAGGYSGFIGIWDWQTAAFIDSVSIQGSHPQNMIPMLDVDLENDRVAAVAYHGIDGSSIVVWDRADQRQRVVATRSGKAWVEFDSKGRILVASPEQPIIEVLDPSSGEVVQQHPLGGTWNAATLLPDGEHVAICQSRSFGDLSHCWLEVRRIEDWDLTFNRYLGEATATDVCATRDGQSIAVGNANGEILQLSFNNDRVHRRRIHNDAIRSLVYSSDGQYLASTERSRYAYVIPAESPADSSH